MKLFKLTPFLIVFGILEVIFIVRVLHYTFVDNNGGMALAAVINAIAAFIVLIILLADRIAIHIKNINIKLLWIVEIILISGLGIYALINRISPTDIFYQLIINY